MFEGLKAHCSALAPFELMSVLRSVIGRFASKSQFSDLRGPCNSILARSMGSKASVDGIPVEVG